MKKRKQISSDEARRIGDSLYIDWDQVDLEQFRQGLMGIHQMDPETSPFDEVLLPAKVVLAHVEEFPDYFTRLEMNTKPGRVNGRNQVSSRTSLYK
jgi:hypothetical protein